VRIFAPQNPVAVMYSDNPQFGFWNLPNLKNKKVRSEENCPYYHITTDAKGYRGNQLGEERGKALPTEMPKPAGARRVLVLGDSFTFGVGVENDQTFPAQMEKLLRSGADVTTLGSFEVINAGCPGWGTENALAFWRAKANELKPDLLVLAFYRNDLNDNMRHLVYQVAKGKVTYAPKKSFTRMKRISRMIPFYGFLSEHSHLLALVRRTLSMRMTQPKAYPIAPAAPANAHSGAAPSSSADLVPSPIPGNPPIFPWVAYEFETFIPLMESFMESARTRGIPFLLVLVPDKMDCSEKPSTQCVEAQRLAEYWAREGRLHLLDLRLPVMKCPKGLDALYIPSDGHFTVEGNRVAAEEITREVRRLVLK
jgi:lysophospholipase L1-like esterase